MKKERTDGLFIPAGLFIGLGMGFLYNAIVPGVLIGLGAGFLGMIIYRIIKKK